MLTLLLVPLLTGESGDRANPACLVSVSSIGHMYAAEGIDYACHTSRRLYEPVRAYADSKLANIMFAKWVAWGGVLPGVRACSVHPGLVDTGLWRHVPALAARVVQAVMKQPREGAHAVIAPVLAWGCGHAAACEQGGFHADGAPRVAAAVADDVTAVNALITASARAVWEWWGTAAANQPHLLADVGDRMQVFHTLASQQTP